MSKTFFLWFGYRKIGKNQLQGGHHLRVEFLFQRTRGYRHETDIPVVTFIDTSFVNTRQTRKNPQAMLSPLASVSFWVHMRFLFTLTFPEDTWSGVRLNRVFFAADYPKSVPLAVNSLPSRQGQWNLGSPLMRVAHHTTRHLDISRDSWVTLALYPRACVGVSVFGSLLQAPNLVSHSNITLAISVLSIFQKGFRHISTQSSSALGNVRRIGTATRERIAKDRVSRHQAKFSALENAKKRPQLLRRWRGESPFVDPHCGSLMFTPLISFFPSFSFVYYPYGSTASDLRLLYRQTCLDLELLALCSARVSLLIIFGRYTHQRPLLQSHSSKLLAARLLAHSLPSLPMRSWRTWNLTSVSALEEWSGDSVVVRYAFVYWYGGSTCFQASKVNLHTSSHLRRKRAARLVWGTCLVLARRDAMSDFSLASSLIWVGDSKTNFEESYGSSKQNPCTERCDFGLLSSSLLGVGDCKTNF